MCINNPFRTLANFAHFDPSPPTMGTGQFLATIQFLTSYPLKKTSAMSQFTLGCCTYCQKNSYNRDWESQGGNNTNEQIFGLEMPYEGLPRGQHSKDQILTNPFYETIEVSRRFAMFRSAHLSLLKQASKKTTRNLVAWLFPMPISATIDERNGTTLQNQNAHYVVVASILSYTQLRTQRVELISKCPRFL